MRASKVLHDNMFSSMLQAPMRFFDTNPSGRILNRFSKDMGAIDELLPKNLMEAIQISLVGVGILLMVLIVNPIMICALAGAIVLFYCIIKLYIRPSQDLKRLEGITRSPVFSHLTATISGLSTIRARNIQQELSEEFDNLQDVHSAVWQLTISSNNACGLWLDTVSTGFIACVAFSFIVLYGSECWCVGCAIFRTNLWPFRHIQRKCWLGHFSSFDFDGNGPVWRASGIRSYATYDER